MERAAGNRAIPPVISNSCVITQTDGIVQLQVSVKAWDETCPIWFHDHILAQATMDSAAHTPSAVICASEQRPTHIESAVQEIFVRYPVLTEITIRDQSGTFGRPDRWLITARFDPRTASTLTPEKQQGATTYLLALAKEKAWAPTVYRHGLRAAGRDMVDRICIHFGQSFERRLDDGTKRKRKTAPPLALTLNDNTIVLDTLAVTSS